MFYTEMLKVKLTILSLGHLKCIALSFSLLVSLPITDTDLHGIDEKALSLAEICYLISSLSQH